ncbi:MAG: 23S rRNA (pseudouridine(1915)-N(3))-methyltransferase RlmH [Alphaproteobacteria bacterium]|nr:23S rRNA (pseudouridine(1915)-N(3))-methyltransferase RlmH [Alphaproteobacteria bacterium]
MPCRISILAIGRARGSPESELARAYLARLPWPVATKEFEERRRLTPGERREREGALLLGGLPKGARLIALDERGSSLTSQAFAEHIGRWTGSGSGDLCFAIGGADGLSDSVRQRAEMLLSLGSMTWPHMLVRLLLAEQLYRAHTILAGHPYHRA